MVESPSKFEFGFAIFFYLNSLNLYIFLNIL